ncbi:NAD(P)-dependent dehydrogenase (short-subunit alcohol dehydrogenase family) [Pseudomonas sp. JUb42]|jgi:NAD(P)-dependent dehydrogenase (short-subunit alcohol dehydrogenase family)|uniref:SDR family NAD(P)-dependent oxidoreductase n=1 Tax=Pseudomonas sp. JUb42 TaxID=2940611 RepID=UPI002167F006|nr:SDR family oxidoreductase [Pseudomonas sp. JUb42]MCS3467506.1 NAD(P)-dependent dehydrogenase (short-subunit alcohol dehydrogenase family) [Pseudomonas sp. JUb42]
MLKLEGKVALITGGNSGIGLATAQRFAEQGAHVFITGRRQAQLDEAIASIKGQVDAVQGDVTCAEDLDKLFESIKAKAGRLDILVTSSGVAAYATLDATTPEHFDQTFDVNVRGMVFTVQRAVQLMSEGASIVLVGSIAGSIGNPGYGTYSATKAAVRSYSRTWAKELAGRGIRVNTVSPGPIDTPMMDGASEEVKQGLTSMIAMNRLGAPDEVAGAVLYLASADSSYVTGAELVVDGGFMT